MKGPAAWGVPAPGRESHGGVRAERDGRLYDTLAIRRSPDDDRTVVILQSRREQFRRTRGTLINEQRHGKPWPRFGGGRGKALGVGRLGHDGSGEVLVPFVSAMVPTVDIAAGTVTLTPPPGLFEELPEDDTAPSGS